MAVQGRAVMDAEYVGETYTFTVAGQTFEAVPFLHLGERSVSGKMARSRVAVSSEQIGEEDIQLFMLHQLEIPAALRGKVTFVFVNCHIGDNRTVVTQRWRGGYWQLSCVADHELWSEELRIVRRK